jgi:3-oxoacyl-[acyl-carrier-protein] synthase II
MANHSRRAVLTGFGVLSPIGVTPAAFWDGLLAGRSGVRPITLFDASPLPCHIAGEVPDFVPKNLIEKTYRKSLNAMSRMVQLGVVAAQMCMQDGGLKKGDLPAERFGVEFGAVMGATEIDDFPSAARHSATAEPRVIDMEAWGAKSLPDIAPMWMLKYLPNMPACHATILYDARGPSNTQINGEVAGVLAFGEAYRILQRDAADVMLVGGTDSRINPLSMSRFNQFAPLSKKGGDPTKALRPFDRDRDGTVLGEAAAVFGLEELGTAKKRGAKVLAELVGFASGVDPKLTGTAFAKVIRNAMADAGIQPADVDHVNAHGSGAVALDVFEAKAINAVFGKDVPVFAPASFFGSTGPAAGVVETAASVLALHHGQLPGTLNHEHPDPACPVAVHTGAPREVRKKYVVKTAYTDLGHVAAMVLRKWEGE